MPKSYSNDLRKKAIECVKEGTTYEEVSKRFKVSLSAIGKWYKRYKEEGIYEQKNRGGSAKKIDIEKLKSYAESNPDMKLKEASKEFKVSMFTISYWLRELGFSYKKKTLPTWKQTKKRDKNIWKR
jgi:transposase